MEQDRCFNLRAAYDENYDSLLCRRDAPQVCFFTASLYNDKLPTISPYPRCDLGQNEDCLYARQQMVRIKVPTRPLLERLYTDECRLYYVNSFKKKNYKYTQHLYLLSDGFNFEWCQTHLQERFGRENNIFAIRGDEIIIVDMNQNHVVNVACTFDLRDIFDTHQAIQTDSINHYCRKIKWNFLKLFTF